MPVYTAVLLTVERDTPCTTCNTAGGGEGYTLHLYTADTPCNCVLMIHPPLYTADVGERYTLHVHTAGDGEGYNMHVHIAGGVGGYTLQVHITGACYGRVYRNLRRIAKKTHVKIWLINPGIFLRGENHRNCRGSLFIPSGPLKSEVVS
jgi:hypothetical protein